MWHSSLRAALTFVNVLFPTTNHQSPYALSFSSMEIALHSVWSWFLGLFAKAMIIELLGSLTPRGRNYDANGETHTSADQTQSWTPFPSPKAILRPHLQAFLSGGVCLLTDTIAQNILIYFHFWVLKWSKNLSQINNLSPFIILQIL